MNYPRLPRNIYSYRATIFGVPLRDALIISTVASASLIAIRFSVYAPLVSLFLLPWMILRKSSQSSRIGKGAKLKMKGKEFALLVSARFIAHNDHMFLHTEGHACLFFEVVGLNVLAMRTGSQISVMERLRTAIEDSEIGMDFFTAYHETGEGKYLTMEHSTFVRFSRRTSEPQKENALNRISSTGMVFQNSLRSAGIKSRELKEREEIEGLLNSLIA